MTRKKQTRGQCTYCKRTYAKSGMLRHLPACSQRHEAIEEADEQTGANEYLFHLRAQDAWSGDFWLDWEVRGSATLQQIDEYLRAIWLECCGHLSRFSIGGAWGSEKISMNRQVGQIFAPDVELTHIYDFGTSSETTIKCVSMREGKPTTSHPIALMARNSVPEDTCIECGQPAAWLCMDCLYETGQGGLLCDQHAESHSHDNYGEPAPLVNSPRTGMCGYTGPAEPPY